MGRGGLADLVEELDRLAVRHALRRGIGPGFDFNRSVFVGLIRPNPLEDFSVAFAGGELRAKRFRFDTEEAEDALIERAVVMILAVFAGDFRAAFVEHPRKEGVAAEAGAGAAGRALGEVGDVTHIGVVVWLTSESS